MKFVGNKKALNFIEKTLERDATSQAYLFSGPESVGKFFLAKIFAKSLINGAELNFEDERKDNAIFDMVIIKPEIEERKGVVKERDITIEKIRDARKDLALYPHSGERKVLIVDNAHKMNITSQNAFLKILEEPNSTTVIILVTHEDSKIISTIKSRCQKINFGLAGEDEFGEIGKFLGEDFVKRYGFLAMGRPGLLVRMSQEKEVLAEYEESLEEFKKISFFDLNQKLLFAEKMSKDVNSALKIMNIWIWNLRKIGQQENGDKLRNTYAKISAIEEAIKSLKNTNASARLILENLLLSL